MRLRHPLRDERGIGMTLVVLMTAVLALLSVTLIELVRNESNRSTHANWSEGSFQAAEAGLDDYVAKLVDDHGYYLHYVHPAESTRRSGAPPSCPGAVVAANPNPLTPTPWPSSAAPTWCYPNGKDTWRSLSNGYEYNLQIFPPNLATGERAIRIVATGRRQATPVTMQDARAIEAFVQPSSLAEFYRFVGNDDLDIDAHTYGQIYVNGDLSASPPTGNLRHSGTAHADIFAENQITTMPALVDGAKAYDRDSSPNIRSKIPNPIDFARFLTSFNDIQRAAASNAPSTSLDDPSVAAWWITFSNAGTFTVRRCSRSGGQEVWNATPNCVTTGAGTGTYTIPSNGAVYTGQTAIVSGQVDGRVTVASNDRIVVGNATSLETAGDDVLGLAAINELIVAQYVPSNLTWTASVLVQSGRWRSAGSSGTHSLMTFTGSAATRDGGFFTQFDNRIYGYDLNLLYLPPPWFPAIDDNYEVNFFREVRP
jgi:Tfp pilus assembly protein PilX